MALSPGNADFIPLVFAADINVYSVVRAFHEEYQVASAGFGKAMSGPIIASKILDYQMVEQADQPETLSRLVTGFAEAHPDQQVLVIGCGDNYVRSISLQKGSFPPNVIAPYIDFETLNRLANKQLFYGLCDLNGIDHPATFVYQEPMGGRLDLGFEAPFIAKPANGVAWWEHPFEGQRKVHIVPSLAELKTLLSTVYAHGYPDSMIIQEYVPGPDSQLYTLTQYYDQAGSLKMSLGGHVLCEEHTAHGVGNSVVVVSQDLPGLTEQLTALLQSLGYRGFASFDIKLDPRDQCFKVFEVNTRQARNNYYVTGSGMNIARFITEDLVYNRPLLPELTALDPFVWHVTPLSVVRSSASQAGIGPEVEELIRRGRSGNPLDYPHDRSLMRSLWLARYTAQQGRMYQDHQRGA